MGRVSRSVLVGASLAEAWSHYFDERCWSSWVDGFHAVEAKDGYPLPGSTLRWRSVPAGRGTVTERVIEHEPRRRHRIEFADPQSGGELLTEFEMEGEGTRVTVTMDYRLTGGGPLSRLTDVLFIRGQLGRSVERSLARLRLELESARE